LLDLSLFSPLFFSSMLRRPPSSPLFPYTTLFRSTLRPSRPRPRIRVRSSTNAFRGLPGLRRVRAGPKGARAWRGGGAEDLWCARSEEHTSELQSLTNLVCRLLLEKKKYTTTVAEI